MQKLQHGKTKLHEKCKSFDISAVTCKKWTNTQKIGFFSSMLHFLHPCYELKVYNLASPVIETRHSPLTLLLILIKYLRKAV